MRVEIVIQELLYTKNFITIPGFGSLVTDYQPARIIKSDSVKFIPPRKVVAFNQQAEDSDDLLLKTLCEDYTLSEELAKAEIDDFVAQTKLALEDNNQYQIEGLGIFYYDSESNIQFQSDENINYLMQTFGLSGFSVQAIPQQEILEAAIRKHEQETDPIRKKIFKSLFIAIPVIFAIILIPNILHLPQTASIFSMFDDTEVYVDLSEPKMPVPEASSAYFNNPEPSNAAYDTPLGENQPDQKTKSEPKPETEPEIIVEPVALEAKYYLIVGSFKSEWKAHKFADKLKAKSYNAGVLLTDGRIRVFASEYTTREEAISYLSDLRQQNGFEAAWLFAN